MVVPLAVSAIDDAELEPAPIPQKWVIDGQPAARCAVLSRSADGSAMTAVWDCTAGSFNWFFRGDETVHIVEGEVTVDVGTGPRTLRPGDVAHFPAGTNALWTVRSYVKKLAFCRDTAMVARPSLRQRQGADAGPDVDPELSIAGRPAQTGDSA